jgi:Tol biopolymer transport system component
VSASRFGVGTRVGPYEIVSLLGRGGMGEVYRARDVRLSRDVALKVLHTDVVADRARVRRFEQEARAAGLLNHPNIVAVYDAGESDGSPYIVSELLEGATLRERLATGGLGSRKAVEYAAQVARGLAAAHERGIVHRDLKPENLFVTRDGLVKILDFGVAKLGRAGDEGVGTEAETQSATTPGTVLGTVGYMSPEQARGLAADHRSDVFSLGTVFFEMLTGRRAFSGTTAADTLSAILREDPTEGIAASSSLPASLLRIVRRCLEKAPEDRFQSARDLAFALEGVSGDAVTGVESPSVRPLPRRWWRWVGFAAALAISGTAVWKARVLAPVADAAPPTYQRLTFRIGSVLSARFAPDGETVLYSAAWGSEASEVFLTRTSARESRALGLTDAKLLAVSSKDEMALLLHPSLVAFEVHQGTLARAAVGGGSPREVAEDVLSADWSPDGKDLALVQVAADGAVELQYPPGHVLYSPAAPRWISSIAMSPRGNRIAFTEHGVAGDMRGDLRLVDLAGRATTLAQGYTSINKPVWSDDGEALWYSAARTGGTPRQVYRVDVAGRERVADEVPGGIFLLDLSPRGQMLIARGSAWTEVRARAGGALEETELAAADLSYLSDLADDGSVILGTDIGQGSGPNYRFYVQKTDGSAPIWLGEGDGQALSPDGRFAVALLTRTSPQQLVVVPTRAGEARVLERGPVNEYQRAVWDPSGRRVVFSGAEREGERRLYVQDVDGGPPRAVSPTGVQLLKIGRPVSPDGTRVVAAGPDGIPALYPLAGGDPSTIPRVTEDHIPLCFTPDGRGLFVARYEEIPPTVYRVEIASGRRWPWSGLRRGRPSGLYGDYALLVTPDGASYAYSYTRTMRDIYLVTGMR